MPVRPKVIATQLMWREFFYTMSVDNPFYAEMDRNPVEFNLLFLLFSWKCERLFF